LCRLRCSSFKSEDKYDHGNGWPSFKEALAEANLEYKDDFYFGFHQIEVTCATCGAHLGHVFDDGPAPRSQALLHQLGSSQL